MHHKCVCARNIIGNNELCNECLAIYGAHRAEWPEWLKFLVNDIKRELRREKEFDKHEITFTDLGVY